MVFGDLELNFRVMTHPDPDQTKFNLLMQNAAAQGPNREKKSGRTTCIYTTRVWIGKKSTHILAKDGKNSLGGHFHYIKSSSVLLQICLGRDLQQYVFT